MTRPAALLALCCALLATSVQAQLTKCVDERGRTHYTDKPIPGCKPVAMKDLPQPAPKASPPPAPGPAAKTEPPAKGAKAGKSGKPVAKLPLSENEKERLVMRCRGLQQEFDYLAGPSGEGTQAREARLGQVKQAMRGCP